jgi:hypothetical protein
VSLPIVIGLKFLPCLIFGQAKRSGKALLSRPSFAAGTMADTPHDGGLLV